MLGGQAKNLPLMQLFANVCSVPVILPHSHSAAVVIGAAMLGRYAAEVTDLHNSLGKDLFASQAKVKEIGLADRERLWEIMVEMTQPGTRVLPSQSPREKRLLDAKYKIFRESIEIQLRWRQEMEQASQA